MSYTKDQIAYWTNGIYDMTGEIFAFFQYQDGEHFPWKERKRYSKKVTHLGIKDDEGYRFVPKGECV